MDFETIKFISLLNELAEKTKNGYIPFSKATSENIDCILYDETETYSNGYPIILDTCMDEIHHDIIDTEDDEPFINITSKYDKDVNIVVESGRWYTI
mgnify:CR=1 FL=1